MRVWTPLFMAATVALLNGCGAAMTLSATAAGAGLSQVTSDQAVERAPELSPDGQVLLFDVRNGSEETIAGIDPKSGARRTVYTSTQSRASNTAWDPAGRFFVYTSNAPGRWSLVRALTPSPNSAVAIILSGEVAPAISDPFLSPDGRRVAFSTFARGLWQLAIVGIDGTNLTFMGPGQSPSWSPDGSRLAFVRTSSGRAHIFTMNPETGGDLVQITNGANDNITPAWSPDGRLLVFASNRSGNRASGVYSRNAGGEQLTGQFNLFVIQADGSNLVQLTDGTAANIDPHWSRDGWIYFASSQSGSFDIWRMRPQGLTAHRP